MKKSPLFPAPEVWWPHRVSYGETDAMGIVYYANYLHWFEQARSHFIRELGLSYSEIEARGILLPVREAFCRYRAPARFENLISIRTGIRDMNRASITFVYEVYNQSEDNRLMTSGYTQHPCMGRDGKPVAVPQWLKALCMETPD